MFIIAMFGILLITIHNVNAGNISFPLVAKTIIIDPGHGGVDIGASHGNVLEKNINLQISLFLKSLLEQKGAAVIMTRDGDYDLSKPNAISRKRSDFDNRIIVINNSNADVYLSIHVNIYSDSKYKGPQVFYTTINSYNQNIAKIFQQHLNSFTKLNREIKIMPNVYMYKKLNPKGVLIECGFISNYFDRTNLQNTKYQQQFAIALMTATVDYFN